MVIDGWVDHLGKDLEAGTHKQQAQNLETPESKMVDSAGVPLDLARLKEISRGDTEFQKELLQIFMEDALEHLAEVKLAFQTKDYLTLARRAHQLKGASATVAILQLPDLAAQLERQAIEHQLTDTSELIAKLEQILEHIQTFINDNYTC